MCESEIIKHLIPQNWKFELISVLTNEKIKKSEVTLKVALFSKEEIKMWVNALEELTSTNFSIQRTGNCVGQRVLVKQFMACHHNTRSTITYNPNLKNRTKNTNCPCSLKITLLNVPKKFRGLEKNAPDPEMPCIIVFVPTHNHQISCPNTNKFKRVTDETKETLMDLYKLGHTPATALKIIKNQLKSSSENYEEVLADRSKCPDYNYCYYIFMREFKAGSVDFNNSKKSSNTVVSDMHELTEIEEELTDLPSIETQESNLKISKSKPIDERLMESNEEKGQNSLNELFNIFTGFMYQSPSKTLPVIEIMVERAKKFKTLKSFILSCATFGSACYKRKLGVHANPTARRKINILRKNRGFEGKHAVIHKIPMNNSTE